MNVRFAERPGEASRHTRPPERALIAGWRGRTGIIGASKECVSRRWCSSFAIAGVAACTALFVAPGCDTESSTNGDAPPLLETASRPAIGGGVGSVDAVHCEGWVGIGGSEDCVYIWSNCSDREDREVRCSRRGDLFRCACIRGGASITSFESAAFCELAAGALSVDRAILSEAVLPGCGWSIRP